MEDPVLNRNLEEIKELQTRWNQFHDFVNMAMQQGLSKITPQAELKFLELKSRIAMLHDGFMGGVKGDVKTAQNIIMIVGDCILLRKVAGASDAERQKFEFDWNECFMLLTETISSMDEEKKRLAGINERAHKAAQRREIMKAQFHNFVTSSAFKWTVTTVVIIFVLFGLPLTGLYKWTQLYINPPFKMDFTKKIYTLVMEPVWRPFIDKDFEFLDYDEVPVNAAPTANAGAESGKASFNEKNFVTTALGGFLGMSGSELDEAKKLFEGRKDWKGGKDPFYNEASKMGGLDVTFAAMLFYTSADAKKFCELCKSSVAKSPNKDKLVNSNAIGRKANLVVFSHGSGPHRWSYIGDKWYMWKDAKSELE